MINPKTILGEWVAVLSSIPQLVAALTVDGEGNAPPWSNGPIQAYSDGPATDSNLRVAILQMPPGSILVAWLGTAPRRLSGALLYAHKFSMFLRAPETGVGYEDIFNMIVEGVPTLNNSENLAMMHVAVDPGCYPMDLDLPTAQRSTIVVSNDGATFDYFEVTVTLTEIGM